MSQHPLPSFDIDCPHIETTLDKLLKDNQAQVTKLLASKPTTWDTLMQPLEDMDDKLNHFFSPISHLHSVKNSPELREAYGNCLPKLSEYYTALAHNQELFHAIKELSKDKSLNASQKKILDNEIRDFKLAGVHLDEAQKKIFTDLQKELNTLTTQFENNVLDATTHWKHLVTDKNLLSGIPSDMQQQMQTRAQGEESYTEGQEAWLLTIDPPTYVSILTHADNPQIRQQCYEAYVTRASAIGPDGGQFNNDAPMNSILDKRLALANILDFDNFAQYALTTKMVKQPQKVFAFLQELLDAGYLKANNEFSELQKFATEHHNMNNLEAWDVAYISEKYRQHLFNISQEELRPYFPCPQVVEGLFSIAKTLFNIDIRPVDNANTWDPHVQCYSLHDIDNKVLAYFYMDLYARDNKRGGAWMDSHQQRRLLSNGDLQLPIAFITCNFQPPQDKQDALLRHDDVVTLFHEFGHSLQHMLTQENYPEVSGINGVPWDAVELPSQLLENWAWEQDALSRFAKHVDTGETIPPTLFNKLNRAKNFQSAMQMMRQIEFALFDFRLHMEFNPKENNQVQTVLDEVRKKVTVTPISKNNRFQNSFSHIFAGGYAAGYYSYKWAEVMSSDAFAKFKEEGIFNQDVSTKFLETFLERGGAVDPEILFKEFRGRDPEISALLVAEGICDK